MCTSDAFSSTAVLRMLLRLLMINRVSGFGCRVSGRCKTRNPTPETRPLHSALRHSEDFIDGCQALDDLLESILAQRDQSAFATQLPQLRDIRVARHHVAQAVVHHQ